MKQFQVFNPEHDLALANGERHFIAPNNIREMARDLAPLLEAMDSKFPMVWGWDAAIVEQLRRKGIPPEELPTDKALAALRTCSERKTAHHLLSTFMQEHPNDPYIGESILARSTDDIAAYTKRHGHIVLKNPLSSSGKGLRHVRSLPNPSLEGGNSYIAEGLGKTTNSPSVYRGDARRAGALQAQRVEDLGGSISNWATALIRRHGYLTAEPYYTKVQDFAMEFYVADGQCRFIGYSLFTTNPHGRYEGNILMEDEKIESLLAQYVGYAPLHEVRMWIIDHMSSIVPATWNTHLHPLYFGVDMMIVDQKPTVSSERSAVSGNHPDGNSELKKLHPCVEINLRLNMGIIAHEVRRKFLTPHAEGTFHVVSYATMDALNKFRNECRQTHPAVYQGGKVASGYHPLTPILPDTRYHAYVLCR